MKKVKEKIEFNLLKNCLFLVLELLGLLSKIDSYCK